MLDLVIDSDTGDVRFSDGLVLTSSLTEDTLSTLPRPAKLYQLNAIPFRWYTMEIGTLGEYPYRVELCFFENNIVYLDLHIDDDKVLDYTDLETFQNAHERLREFQNAQDELLRKALGEPHDSQESERNPRRDVVRFSYRYAWGEVTARHGLSACIRIEYAGRRDGSMKRFRMADVSENLSAVQKFRAKRLLPSE